MTIQPMVTRELLLHDHIATYLYNFTTSYITTNNNDITTNNDILHKSNVHTPPSFSGDKLVCRDMG